MRIGGATLQPVPPCNLLQLFSPSGTYTHAMLQQWLWLLLLFNPTMVVVGIKTAIVAGSDCKGQPRNWVDIPSKKRYVGGNSSSRDFTYGSQFVEFSSAPNLVALPIRAGPWIHDMLSFIFQADLCGTI